MIPIGIARGPAPFRIPIRFQAKDGLILLDQLRALDKQRLVRRLGTMSSGTLRTTLRRLRDVFTE